MRTGLRTSKAIIDFLSNVHLSQNLRQTSSRLVDYI